MGIDNNAKYIKFQLIKSKARRIKMAAIGNDAKRNMIKIAEKFKKMIESNERHN